MWIKSNCQNPEAWSEGYIKRPHPQYPTRSPFRGLGGLGSEPCNLVRILVFFDLNPRVGASACMETLSPSPAVHTLDLDPISALPLEAHIKITQHRRL